MSRGGAERWPRIARRAGRMAVVLPPAETAADSTALRRFMILLLTAFSAVALLLTATGIYGMLRSR